VEVPKASYENLSITHLEMPDKFKNISQANFQTIAEDVVQLKEWIESNSSAGEDVLVVLPKRVCEYLKGKMTIYGRAIHLANWGMGIGCNDWKHCTSVYLFDEFHLPKEVYLTMTAMSSCEPCSLEVLKQMHGSARTGQVKDTMLGHRYMHLVQMASRGNMRSLDALGRCGEMKLFTTMDRAVLMEGVSELFPRVPEPKFVSSSEVERNTVSAKLCDYLINTKEVKISAPVISVALEVPSKGLTRAFKRASCSHLHYLGWRVEKGNGRSAPAYFIKEEFDFSGMLAQLNLAKAA